MKANACPVTSGWAHKPMFYWVEAIAFRSTHVCIVEGGCRVFNCSKVTGGLQYDCQMKAKTAGFPRESLPFLCFLGPSHPLLYLDDFDSDRLIRNQCFSRYRLPGDNQIQV